MSLVAAGLAFTRIRVKPGVQFTRIAPGGFRLLAALECAAQVLGRDVTITSACEGVHSGPSDPHPLGQAYDVRTRGLPEAQKDELLAVLMAEVRDVTEGAPQPVAGIPRSLATRRFFGFIEKPGTENEHLHAQVRRGRSYP